VNNLLLLHGALGSKGQFSELENLLGECFKVYSLNFSGHGGLPIPEEPFSIDLFSKDVLKWMEENKVSRMNIFGYSMGGYVALYIARHYPQKICKIFTIATKFKWNEDLASKEIKMLDPVKINEKVPAFAKQLKKRHSPQDWENVLKKTAEMMKNLGENNALNDEDFRSIENQVLVAIGDRDRMVTLDETVDVYMKLRNGRLLVLPATPHPLEEIDYARLKYEINNFFN